MATGMTVSDRRALLSRWIKPSSNAEQVRQHRAERVIRGAIEAHTAFSGTSIRIYPKGSYANNTNVRLDSDVDIVVENEDCSYFDYLGDFTPLPGLATPYTGSWTPDLWRLEVKRALIRCFGSSDVDTSGKVAMVIAEKEGSRPSVDVVPAFVYYRYESPDRRVAHKGSKVFKSSSGSIVNWPQQQLENGRAKNVLSRQRYKNYVRALKNAENYLVENGGIDGKPSYLMECLIWNVANSVLIAGDLDQGFRSTLVWLWEHLTDEYVYEEWEEPNKLTYLFHSGQRWMVDDAKEVVLKTWQLLEY